MLRRRLTRIASLTSVAVVALSANVAAQSPQSPGPLPTVAPSPVTGAPPNATDAASPDGTTGPARPFGPGVLVEIQCDAPDVHVFVARGIVDDRPAFPDPFVKLGRMPATFELPPGVFTVLVEGENVPPATTSFEVRDKPVKARVRPGSQSLRDLSTLTIAVGIAAILAGGVLEISGTKDEDPSKKRKISIPLFIGGGLGLAGGIGMAFASATSLEHDGYLPTQSSQLRVVPTRGVFLTGQF